MTKRTVLIIPKTGNLSNPMHVKIIEAAKNKERTKKLYDSSHNSTLYPVLKPLMKAFYETDEHLEKEQDQMEYCLKVIVGVFREKILSGRTVFKLFLKKKILKETDKYYKFDMEGDEDK